MSSRVGESSIFKNSKKPFFDELGTRGRGRGNLPVHKGGTFPWPRFGGVQDRWSSIFDSKWTP